MSTMPWRVKKLADDSFAYLVPDAEIKTDAGKMAVHVIVSTETMDRERDILIAKGCVTDDHRKNPIVLTNHRKDWPGVAQARTPDGEYTVKSFDDRVESRNYFHQNSKLALQTFRLVESGALRGVSPGFMTVPDKVRKVKSHRDGQPAFIYDQWRLAEISHCPIGMNPDALVIAVEKGFGGEGLLPELKDMLLPFVPERKAQVTSGWESKSYDPPEEELDVSEIDLSDADAVPLTPSSQYYHAVYQKAFDLFAMTRELNGTLEAEQTKSAGRRIEQLVGGVLDTCVKGHAGHLESHPNQPGLPGGANEDVSSEVMAEWRVKAMEAWDEHRQNMRQAVAEECSGDIVNAVKFFSDLASDRQLPTGVRAVAKRFASKLSNVKMVAVPDDDDAELWGAAAAKLEAVGV